MLCEKRNKITKNQKLKCRFTHYDGDGFLHVTLRDANSSRRQLIDDQLSVFNRSYSKESNYHRNYLYLTGIEYKIGGIYAAIYLPDGLFYRVKIIKNLDYDKVLVAFIDYGNKEIVSKNELAPLPNDIAKLEPLALVCKIPRIKLLDETQFTRIISDIYKRDTSVSFVGKYLHKGCVQAESVEMVLVHLIDFIYMGQSIREYLINNGIAIAAADDITNQEDIWLCDDNPIEINNNFEDDDKKQHVDVQSPFPELIESTKSVIITYVHSQKEIYVHVYSSQVRSKMAFIQPAVAKAAEKFRSRFTDNHFNKKYVYLTQFSEDDLWYRCRIVKFDSDEGFLVQFIDFGNLEYKKSLSDMILLTDDMGDDVRYLMTEDPVAQHCQISKELLKIIPKSVNLRKYLIRNFVEPVRKIKITYSINSKSNKIWLISSIMYHNKILEEILEDKCVLKEDMEHKLLEGESESTSHSVRDLADLKVAEYLLNSCQMPDGFLSMDSDRIYSITHFGGIDQIWVDVSDGQSSELISNLLSNVQEFDIVSEVIIDEKYGIREIHDNTTVTLRCKVVDVCNNYIKVHLIDRGDFKHVQLDDIFILPIEVCALPPKILQFRFCENLQLRLPEEEFVKQYKHVFESNQVRIVRESDCSNGLIDIIIGNRSIIQMLMSAGVVYLVDHDVGIEEQKEDKATQTSEFDISNAPVDRHTLQCLVQTSNNKLTPVLYCFFQQVTNMKARLCDYWW